MDWLVCEGEVRTGPMKDRSLPRVGGRAIALGALALVLGGGAVYGPRPIHALAAHSDVQNWVKHPGNPVLTPACTEWPACDPTKEKEWDSFDVESPSVIKVGRVYHMFYEGDRRETAGGMVQFNLDDRVGHATSPDGIHWTKDPRNPVLSGIPGTDEESVLSPTALYHQGRFWMFYNAGKTFRVHLAISDDGVHWRRMGKVLEPTPGGWDQHGVSDVAVIHTGAQFLMWYTGDIKPLDVEERRAIGLASSADGLNWKKETNAPVLAPVRGRFDDMAVYDASVLLDNGVYRMWYTCVNQALFSHPKHPRGWHICYAWSQDGRRWTRSTGNPVLRPGSFRFEQHEVGSPAVIREGAVYRMWYAGGVFWDLNAHPMPSQAAGIGYATWTLKK